MLLRQLAGTENLPVATTGDIDLLDFTTDEQSDPAPIGVGSSTSSSLGSNHVLDISRQTPDDSQAAALLHALVSNSDQDSSLLLAILRSGCPWELLASAVLSAQIDGAAVNRPLHTQLDLPRLLSYLNPSQNQEMVPLAAIPEHRGLNAEVQYQPHQFSTIINLDRYRPWLHRRFDRDAWKQLSTARQHGSAYNPAPSPNALRTSSTHHRLGNMAFSAAIAANHFPPSTQAHQQHNLAAAPWAVQTLHVPPCQTEPFDSAFLDLMAAASNSSGGVDAVCGPQVCLEALDDEEAFVRAPLLSQIIASIVTSIKSDEPMTSVTQYALMWAEWTLWRWMLAPSPQSYHELPEIMRPSNSQLFIKHRRMFDFIIWPALREHVCNVPDVDRRWLTEACVTVRCDLEWAVEEVVCRNGRTGALELNPVFKVCTCFPENCEAGLEDADVFSKPYIGLPSSWSMGPSVRPFLHGVDSFARIRV